MKKEKQKKAQGYCNSQSISPDQECLIMAEDLADRFLHSSEDLFLDQLLTGRKKNVLVRDLLRNGSRSTTVILNTQEERPNDYLYTEFKPVHWFFGVVKFWPKRRVITFHRASIERMLSENYQSFGAVTNFSGATYDVDCNYDILNSSPSGQSSERDRLAWGAWIGHRMGKFEIQSSIRESVKRYEQN